MYGALQRYRVLAQSAAGTTREVSVDARNDEQACRRALAKCGATGQWRAIRMRRTNEARP